MSPQSNGMPTIGEIARRVNDHHKTLYGEGDNEGVRDMAIRHDYFIQEMKEGRKWRMGLAAVIIGGVVVSLILQAMTVVRQTAIESVLRGRSAITMPLSTTDAAQNARDAH